MMVPWKLTEGKKPKVKGKKGKKKKIQNFPFFGFQKEIKGKEKLIK